MSHNYDLLLNIVNTLFTSITGMFALYIFYLQLCNKISFVSFSYGMQSFYGKRMALTLHDKSFSPICITGIQIVLNDQFRITIPLKSYVHIEPRKLETFVLNYTSINTTNDSLMDYICTGIIINTPHKKIIINNSKKCNSCLLKYPSITPFIKELNNGQIIGDDVKYVLVLRNKYGEKQTIYINDNGFMSSDLVDFNAIERQYCTTKNILEQYLKDNKDTFFKDLDFTLSEV